VRFEFVGGVRKPSIHLIEKFFLFFIVDGREFPLYQLVRDGIAIKDTVNFNSYITGLKYGKIFVYQSGFGIPRRFYSFYFKAIDPEAEIVTIRPFSEMDSGFFFKGSIRFLKKAQILEILNDEQSKGFVERQEALPVEVIKQIITVERPNLGPVRYIRLGKGEH
jgi:hypothetical protein